MPALAAATTSAPSVGSPFTVHAPSFSTRCASDDSVAAFRSSRRVVDGPTPLPSCWNSPCGLYPAPVTSYDPSPVTMRRTVISFFVSVPVLSVQMTVVDPSVSTVGSLRTSAWRFTMRCTPTASEIVTTAGSASGTTATASAMPKMTSSTTFSPRARPSATMNAMMQTAASASMWPILSRFFCSGVGPDFTVPSRPAIVPNSVFMPVSATTAVPRPCVTDVPANTMFFLSPTGRFSSFRTPVVFDTGTDSPVRGDSSTFSCIAVITRASAGTLSPASSSTMSPGTNSSAGMSRSSPSRSTVATGAESFCSNSIARSARYSCTKPSSAEKRTITPMLIASISWPRESDNPAPSKRMTMRTFLNWAKSSASGDAPREAMRTLRPSSNRRNSAWAVDNPPSGFASSAEIASSVVNVCQGRACMAKYYLGEARWRSRVTAPMSTRRRVRLSRSTCRPCMSNPPRSSSCRRRRCA